MTDMVIVNPKRAPTKLYELYK